MSTNPITGSSPATAGSTLTDGKSPVPAKTLASQETFLQLLVAQIKNQDPLNPTDGVQFLTQLAQFSSLEQQLQSNTLLTDIKTELSNLKPSQTP